MNSGPRILVFGANSAIGHAVLKLYAAQKARFFLVGRNAQKLQAISDDLQARGGGVVGSASYDFNDWQEHEQCIQRVIEVLGAIDIAVVAHGSLPDQAECETSSAPVIACLEDNFSSAAIIVQACAQQFALQGHGTLAVISSVAGDRGRKSNYVYGSAKAGIDTLLQGLQCRFYGSNVKIVNIKPGMVVSPMTAGMRHGALWSTPDAIAPAIYRAIARGRRLTYVPGYWRLVMFIIARLPTAILARLPI